MRRDYCESSDTFNETLRRSERKFRTVPTEIESISTTNPNDLWDRIRKLGPRVGKQIPIEVVTENGGVTREQHEVLDRWKQDFERLYNGSKSDELETEHYDRSMIHKHLLESNMGTRIRSERRIEL